ncbi:hypothetical protein Lal_00042040 [Lupinus albus]|nr:hypothetical protein Lal_00042040 [Lupinus albus]
MVGTTNIHLVRILDTLTNSKKLSGVEDKEIVGVTLSYQEEPYEMKILRTVLERRFFELNDDRNGCRLNQILF